MADELNIPSHRWYQPRNNIKLAPEDTSQKYIYDSGIQKIDAWINSQPWGVGSLFAYAAAGITPQLVADFKGGTYGKASALSTFDDVLEHSRAGLATMVDADGVLKWCPHNLLLRSEEFDSASWAGFTGEVGFIPDPSGGTNAWEITLLGLNGNSIFQGTPVLPHSVTTSVWVRADIPVTVLFGFYNSTEDVISVNITTDWTLISHTRASGLTAADRRACRFRKTTSGDATIQVYGGHLYRSDLGGMADNPATGNSYVPTTSAARYLPRENHHVYNGSAWVKEGYLHEPEAATNLVTYSQDFTNTSWVKSNTAALAIDAVGPDGGTSAVTLADSGATGTAAVSLTLLPTVSTSTTYTYSVYAKADQLNFLMIRSFLFTTGDGFSSFDLSSGNVSTESGNHTATIENAGNGWYRCAITFTTDGTDTSGQLISYVAETDTLPSTPTVPLDGTSSILIYGAQFEQGSVPTSYIPTLSGSQVTRAADILTLPVENIPYPEPVVIGEELVTNGTFDSDSDWTLSTGASIADGILVFASGASDQAVQPITLDPSKQYLVTIDVVRRGGGLSLRFTGGTTNNFESAITATGSYTYIVTPNAGNDTLLIVGTNTANDFDIDNISVREINPLAVSFGYKALVTYADDGATSVIWYDWRLNSANYLQANLRTQSTATGEVYALQAASGVTDDVDGRFSQYSPGINVPMSLASRHGSTFINVAVDGVALTADTTPTAFPDLSATDLVIAPSGGPQVIQEFIMWGGTTGDIGDVGIAEASA